MRLMDVDNYCENICLCNRDQCEKEKCSVFLAPTIDAVPVVRCKDCKYSREIDRTKSPEKYYSEDCVVCQCEDVVGDEEMIYFYTHFCSYGERKDNA